ncbi:tetratricopeptide repeat protein, partial [bacterium]|nr:tetratricopeptide repeat protein [bacterium]
YQKAIEESQKAIDAFPNVKPSDKGTFGLVVVCYHTIAKSYKALEDLKKAEETYQTIIDRFPNTKVAQIAHERIRELRFKP